MKKKIESLYGGCACRSHSLDQLDELRVRGGDGEVVAEPEVLVDANQDLLQLDDLRLQLDLCNIVTARVGLADIAVCAVVR